MKRRVTIVAPSPSTFVVRDIALLSDVYEVDQWFHPTKIGLQAIPRLLMMVWKIMRSDAIITWFADASYYPVRLAKFLRIKSVVIVAGYDVAAIPSIGYGALLNPDNMARVAWALRNASVVTAVDCGLIENMRDNFGGDFGALVVPTGYDHEKYRPSGEKQPIVLSVCTAFNKRGLVKGIDIFAECARRIPEIKFILIGTREGALQYLGELPENLTVIESLPADEIIHYYQEAKVYCQLSMREGFPNAVCEAMLCECVAVGSDVQGIRTAIDGHGFLVPYGDVEATCAAIREALKSDGKEGRRYIMENFSEERRRLALTGLINRLSTE